MPLFPAYVGYARWVPTTPPGNVKWKTYWPQRRYSRWGHFYSAPITPVRCHIQQLISLSEHLESNET